VQTGYASSHVKRVCCKGQTRGQVQGRNGTGLGTLLLGDLSLSNVRKKAGIGGAAQRKILTGLVQTQLAIHGKADFFSVFVFLAVIFPPANGAQRQGACRFQRLESATWTSKTSLQGYLSKMDGVEDLWVTPMTSSDRAWNFQPVLASHEILTFPPPIPLHA
jgi:hypothetical protein